MTERDPLEVPYRERERSVTMEPLGEEERHDELLTLNIGPHHPATHGVLRLLTTLEGEVVRDVTPIIGYVHTSTGSPRTCSGSPPGRSTSVRSRCFGGVAAIASSCST